MDSGIVDAGGWVWGMKKSCKYCGGIHPVGYECPMRPRHDRPRNSSADKFRKTRTWRKKRDAVVSRDFHMCRVCADGQYGTYQAGSYYTDKLSVHHIEPLEERYDLRLEEDNLLTCCPWHHKMADDGEIDRNYLHGLAKVPPRWVTGLGKERA